ncbi:LOW QUALITY PROTEIN: cyclic AMP-dependent transcription factor ATF-4 [Morone saxatilis]|uniref:LOW QUALITY PROTEIN: cyclic AMP-dependent transcription factor ATF-4 n=1 Tax=Morone saxatilis TaxID=34816 RepID=UPI0015E1DC67|nr:LOW QUALITY PROTEIN: cyclic AMP-dependent transcription factor ATF-4 [Morone saxatilis]
MSHPQLALEDVEALCFGPSFLMADPMGPLLDQDEEEALSPSSSLEGKAPASPPLSFSSYASSLSPYQTLSFSPLSSASPPPSPPPPISSFLGTKAGTDSLSLPWLGASDLLTAQVGADDGKDDAFAGMDWMSEKIDLSEFDLDSLIGSCSSDESPSSPEDLLASLDSHMDLDLDSFDATIPAPHDSLELGLSLPSIPPLPLELALPGAAEAKKTEVAPDQEVVMKSEPPSPAPSPKPPSPAYTLELGSEVDVLDAEKTATSLKAIIPDSSGSIQATSPIVFTLPTAAHIVVVLANKDEPPVISLPEQPIESSPPSDCDSDSGIESVTGSPSRLPSPPTAGSSRTKPYSKPELNATSSPSAKTPKVKSVSGAPKVEKKLKKMEQNKTAATRYRQKKRVEQELLGTELEGLEKRNHELTEKAESISREIQYLKDLMEEVRKHRRGKTSSVA